MPKKPPRLRYRFETRSIWATAPLVLNVSLSRNDIEAGDYAHFGEGWQDVVSADTARSALGRVILARVPGVIVEGRRGAIAISINNSIDIGARLRAATALEEVLAEHGTGELVRVLDWGLEVARVEAARRHSDDRTAIASDLRPLALGLMTPYLDGRRRTRTPLPLLNFLQGAAGSHAIDAARWQYRQSPTNNAVAYYARVETADQAERELEELVRGGWIRDLVRQAPNPYGSVEFNYQPNKDFTAFREVELIRL